MSSTLHLTGDGNIFQNSDNPANGDYKLNNSVTGDGHRLWIQGSHAGITPPATGDYNGGNVRIQGGNACGLGRQGSVEIVGGFQISKNYDYPSIVVVPPPTGDPVTDTNNINHAIELIAATSSQGSFSNGGEVVLQQGIYEIGFGSDEEHAWGGYLNGRYYGILMKFGITLRGVGHGDTGTILHAASDNFTMIMWDSGIGCNYSQVSDLTMIGNANYHYGNTGLLVGNLEPTPDSGNPSLPGRIVGPIIARVSVGGCDTGIQMCAWKGTIVDSLVHTCLSGIRLEYITTEEDDATNIVTVERCQVDACQEYGIYVRGFVNAITHCVVRTPDYGTGIYVESGFTTNHIVDNYIEVTVNPAYNAVGVYVGSSANVISGNYFDIGGGTKWVLNSESDNVVIGNTENIRVETDPPTYVFGKIPHQLNTDLTVHGEMSLDNGTNDQYLRHTGENLYVTGAWGEHNGIRIEPTGANVNAWMGLYRRDSFTDLYQKVQIHSNDVSYFNGGNVGIGTESPASTLHVEGSIGFKSVVVASNHAAGEETVIFVNSNGTARTISLPDASLVPGRVYYIKEVSNAPEGVTIDPYSSQTIDDKTTLTFKGKHCFQIMAIGSEWMIIGHSEPLATNVIPATATPVGSVTAVPGTLYTVTNGTAFVKDTTSSTSWTQL